MRKNKGPNTDPSHPCDTPALTDCQFQDYYSKRPLVNLGTGTLALELELELDLELILQTGLFPKQKMKLEMLCKVGSECKLNS